VHGSADACLGMVPSRSHSRSRIAYGNGDFLDAPMQRASTFSQARKR
jgi:hypothetical protein